MEAAVRQRKACLNCYKKKVRCDFPADGTRCIRCEEQNLDCTLPDGSQKVARRSMRESLEELNKRVEALEGTGVSGPGIPLIESPNQNQPSPNDDTIRIDSSTSLSTVRTFRGSTSPWTVLVNATIEDSDVSSMNSFNRTITRLADEDQTPRNPAHKIYFNILQEFPQLLKDDMHEYIWDYAMTAPYPVIHPNLLRETVDQLLETQQASSWGQIVCILVYMAFGCAHLNRQESDVNPQTEAGIYFHKAWSSLPHLLLEHDVWALMSLTLVAHYLQASSSPEPCWALLGSATRMAISLGFHQPNFRQGMFTSNELEEGKRAWWLCYVMEKTFSVLFGRPSSISGKVKAERPQVFVLDEITPSNSYEKAVRNELDGVAFFNDMIDLALVREEYLRPSAHIESFQSAKIIKLLGQHKLIPDDGSSQSLRDSISALAHYTALHVVLPKSSEAIMAARASLQLIMETSTDGKTMCLWMWLYYAFSSVVVLFLHCIREPLAEHTTLDIALISDLENLCTPLAPHSRGASRIAKVCQGMEKVVVDFMKGAARSKAKKRSAEDSAEGSIEKRSRLDSHISPGESAPGPRSFNETEMQEVLESTPTDFAWNEWEAWLEDVAFE